MPSTSARYTIGCGPSGADAMRIGATPDATASNPAAANVREIHIGLLPDSSYQLSAFS